ncbi:MAG: efflux RND transporter periplasmic adaptor subunit [Chthonomonadales bacterium]
MKRYLLLGTALFGLATLIGWRLQKNRAAAAEQAAMRQMRMKAPAVVQAAPASVRDIVQSFEGVGSVEAPHDVKVAPKIYGRITFLQVHEGDPVRRGEVLVRLDPSEIQGQVVQQQAALAEAMQRLAQARLTENPNDVSVATQVRQQEAALHSAQADLNQAQQNYVSQVAAAEAAVTDAQGKVNVAVAAVASAQAGIRSAQANLNNAMARFNRMNNLYKRGFVSQQDADDANTAVSVQQAALDVARGQLNAANAQLSSARAQLASAQHQADIVRTTGKAAVEDARAKVAQAQAAVDYAKSNLVQKPAYRANLAALKASVTAAEGMLRNAQAQLANTVLLCPLDGFVTGRYMDPGGMAAPGQPVLAVQSMREVWVSVPVPEEVSRRIHLGQPAKVRLDAIPGRVFVGRVTQINAAADPTSRQFMVRVTLANPQNLLKPGMFARVTMTTQRVRSLAVPREAVHTTPQGPYVMVIGAGNIARQVAVRTGVQDPVDIAIEEGLQPGDRVITLSANPIRDGQAVRPAPVQGAMRPDRRAAMPAKGFSLDPSR